MANNPNLPKFTSEQAREAGKKSKRGKSIKNIIRDDGVTGLWRSYPLTVFMNIPYASMVVCVNENLKTLIQPWNKENPHLWYIICAGIAGGAAGIITNPLDVIKTRI